MKQTDIFELPDGLHAVGDGLYIRVRGNGKSRCWILYTYFNNKRKAFGLGSAQHITLMSAMKKAKQLKGMFASGENPFEYAEQLKQERNAEDQANLHPKPHSFRHAALEDYEQRSEVRGWRNEKHAQQWINTLKTYAFPVIGDMDVAKIKRADVLKVLKPIWKKKIDTAKRLRARIETVFAFAIRNEWRTEANPATWKGNLEFDLIAPAKVRSVKHHEALTFDEMKMVVRDFANKTTTGHLCILFGILTAARTNEFVKAKWDEIDLKKKVWSVPPERRKDGKPFPHRVPLSSRAIEVLLKLPSRSGFLFPGRASECINLESPRLMLSKAARRKVTMHGCRSTFRDWCAETGKDAILAEKSLMHATGSAVEQAYQRSDLLEQRRELMEQWAEALFGRTSTNGRNP